MIDHPITCFIDGREYTSTPDEIHEMHLRELEDFESKTQMTPAEKRALRKWVTSGHSINEHPGSRYICLGGLCPPPDFLSVYRMDHELKQALKGKTKKEKEAYLKDYFGHAEETHADMEFRKAKDMTPDITRKYIHERERECYYLWEFLSNKGGSSVFHGDYMVHRSIRLCRIP